MFQTFDVTSRPEQAAPRIAALRASFAALGINAVLVPRTDEYQGEYVPRSAERLAWLTGFTGSAGIALIMEKEAIVFVDGRYTTQLKAQADPALITGGDLVGAPPPEWLTEHRPKALRLGIDPWLHTPSEVERLEKALQEIGGELVLLAANPVDPIWHDRPAEPAEPISVQKTEFAGRPAADKIAEIAGSLAAKKAGAVLISDSTSVAWLFNIRGNDVVHTPAPLARAIVRADGSAALFVAPEKVTGEAAAYLDGLADVEAPDALEGALTALAAAGKTLMLDRASVPYAVIGILEAAGGQWVHAADPVVDLRAIKNEGEKAGARAVHLQDGAAMVSYLSWLDRQTPGTVSEIDAAKALEAARAATGVNSQNPLKDISFDTISGAGPNAAIIHYRVTTETNRMLQSGEMYLVDSGAQYQNGTTDITRTLAIGEVGEEQKKFFTLVLKGMIAISTARFPVGTRGQDLDPLARMALWQAGVDYAHGTGHGVGSYLSVHEGPQRISRLGTVALKPGMILSNEPGYYRPGAFGIRIENLLLVTEATMVDGGEIPMLGFETLTWCPIDRRLILPQLLTAAEIAWLDDYHARTREKLMPLVADDAERKWLEQATEPVSR
ncbi:aminopeptidase P family protein [Martelella endophytica]|uniref:X-Pro aminopeptidase n=1 Tax=Martelella endophytica TaxID=1486262 RepID=A0A0D5LW04_MAREN|nr:aminopeptidase P family protein [Martelella endophytica]AJY48424.1 X-Pro aminopeptidase [Martelella endophytica]